MSGDSIATESGGEKKWVHQAALTYIEGVQGFRNTAILRQRLRIFAVNLREAASFGDLCHFEKAGVLSVAPGLMRHFQ